MMLLSVLSSLLVVLVPLLRTESRVEVRPNARPASLLPVTLRGTLLPLLTLPALLRRIILDIEACCC